jgi:hypothetical protein
MVWMTTSWLVSGLPRQLTLSFHPGLGLAARLV